MTGFDGQSLKIPLILAKIPLILAILTNYEQLTIACSAELSMKKDL